jgi:hypothetical protein
MPRIIDFDSLWRRAAPMLLSGPATVRELTQSLDISQPTACRLLGLHSHELCVTGRARSVRYLLRRTIPDVGSIVPVYEIDETGQARQAARLHAVGARAFQVESLTSDVPGGIFDDLPYFLDGLRPAGFLGRLTARAHPELGLPQDPRGWSADQTLRYLVRFGWNTVGNFIVGERAFQLYLEHASDPPTAISTKRRPNRYLQLTRDVLAGAPPGSSAGGEQPKFLATRAPRWDVLVKFSPPRTDAVGLRLADLLVSEHLALDVLRSAGHAAAKSELVEAGDRMFLEVRRFDRTPNGRLGLLSLEALDAQFVGELKRGSWGTSVEQLARKGYLDPGLVEPVQWLSTFGELIANSDMHPGNLSFTTRGARVLGVAPVYDMLPMLYAPHQGHLPEPAFRALTPRPSAAPIWDSVCSAACSFWKAVAGHPLISRDFKKAARAHAQSVDRARALGRRLPV